MWHKMSLIGKALLLISGFGLGAAFGFYKADPTVINEGNKVEVEYSGKAKKGASVELNVSDIDQDASENQVEDTIPKKEDGLKDSEWGIERFPIFFD